MKSTILYVLCVLVLTPAVAFGYSQKYYQPYYQPYYQAYYQTYYQPYYQAYYQTYYQGYYQAGYASQSSYGVTFTTPVTALGNVSISGSVGKGGGSFVIDHPLDPFNKLLFHSFVESPDVKNWYDGVAVLDKNGGTTITLPPYFEALNKDFRYQLRGLDKPAPDIYVKTEVENNRFTVAGGPAGGRISWQVTGNRKDPYILANPITPEVPKGKEALLNVGQYIYPEGYGLGEYSPMKYGFQFFAGVRALIENVIRL